MKLELFLFLSVDAIYIFYLKIFQLFHNKKNKISMSGTLIIKPISAKLTHDTGDSPIN